MRRTLSQKTTLVLEVSQGKKNPPTPLGVLRRVRATSGFPIPTLPRGHLEIRKIFPRRGGEGGGYKSGRPCPGLPETTLEYDICGIWLVMVSWDPLGHFLAGHRGSKRPGDASKNRFGSVLGGYIGTSWLQNNILKRFCVQIAGSLKPTVFGTPESLSTRSDNTKKLRKNNNNQL